MIVRRQLGRSGLEVSSIGFGCGGTAGLLIRGDRDEQLAVVQAALDAGITYFDTSPLYGEHRSEIALGSVLRELTASPVVSTKVQVDADDIGDIRSAVRRSVDVSRERLGRDALDLVYLHNRVGRRRDLAGRVLTVEDVIGTDGVADALDELIAEGAVRASGFTALGHTDSALTVLRSGRFSAVQGYVNLLNPSAVRIVPAAWRAQDFEQLVTEAASLRVGVAAIRVLAAGALTPATDLHRHAKPYPTMAAAELAADRARAASFSWLVPPDGSMTDIALRYVLAQPSVDTALVGISDMEQLRAAVASAQSGPLDEDQISAIDEQFRQLYTTA